jgi:hypothetical protein
MNTGTGVRSNSTFPNTDGFLTDFPPVIDLGKMIVLIIRILLFSYHDILSCDMMVGIVFHKLPNQFGAFFVRMHRDVSQRKPDVETNEVNSAEVVNHRAYSKFDGLHDVRPMFVIFHDAYPSSKLTL